MTSYLPKCVGNHFNVGTVKAASGIMAFDKLSNGMLTNLTGLEGKLLHILSTIYNISYTIVDMADSPFGSLADNGTWLGIIGALQTYNLDIGVAYLSIQADRMEVVDFTPPYVIDHISFFVEPQTLEKKDGVFFIEPFNYDAWILLGLSVAAYWALLRVLLEHLQRKTSGNTFLFVVSHLLLQGYKMKDSSTWRARYSTQILVIVWFLTSIIISIFFESSLKAATSRANPLAINTIHQLLPYFESDSLKVCVLDGTNYFDYMRNKGFTHLKSKKIHGVKHKDDSYIRQLIAGNMTYVISANYLNALMYEKGMSEKYHQVEEILFVEYIGIALRKNFPCRQEFSKTITILRDTGCINKWENDLMRPYEALRQKRKSEEAEHIAYINAGDLEYAFIAWFAGLLFAFLSYEGEHTLHLYRGSNHKEKYDTTEDTTVTE